MRCVQAADQAKKQAAELASTKALLASATTAQQKALQVSPVSERSDCLHIGIICWQVEAGA